MNHHVCDQSAANVEAERVKTSIKRRAAQTMETPAVIRAQEIQNIPTPVLAALPNKDAMRLVVKRVRRQEKAPPPAPNSVSNLQIDDYTRYKRSDGREELFLLADSGSYNEAGRQTTERILIFGKESNGGWAEMMRECYVDGTFSIAPTLFHQVFVVLARRDKWVFPVLYGLLTTKTKETYARFFRMVKGFWPNFRPTSIFLDFESAIIGAVREVLPDCELAGRFFHLVRNFKKRLASEGLTQRYKEEPFQESAKMITSMAFVPIDHLTIGIMALEQELQQELQPVLDWFIRNYVGTLRFDGTRNPATFDPLIWNVHRRTVQNRDRTNNYAEAAHRALQREFDCDHPSIWTFIDKLRKHQKAVDADFAKFAMGDRAATKRQKYQRVDRRILTLVQRYLAQVRQNAVVPIQNDHQYFATPRHNHNMLIEFLRGMSHNYEMNL